MGFFRGGERDAAEPAHAQAAGLSSRAEARLETLATDRSVFTSGLSVNEFALLTQLGPEPLAQVMGASVVRTGWQYLPALPPGTRRGLDVGVSPSTRSGPVGPWSPPPGTGGTWQSMYTEPSPAQIRNYLWHAEVICELDVLSTAWNLARRRAIDRLAEEATTVDADAVVGVHLHRTKHDLGKGTIEYVVSGTAIRVGNSPGIPRLMLSDVSVQDYWRLHSAGLEPVGLVATTAVVFASAPRSTRARRLRTTSQNQELEELSRGFQAARESVRTRLRGQVADTHGRGAVGVELLHSVRREKLALGSSLNSTDRRGWHTGRLGVPYFVSGRADAERPGWVITMHAAGTAVRRRRGGSGDSVKPRSGWESSD